MNITKMREIKFRGISKETNEFMYGCYYHHEDENNHYIRKTSKENGVYPYEVIKIYPETLGQYTGFTDKRYKEIYEGDKVKDKYGNVYEVVFENGRFMCLVSTVYLSDNPRLLSDLMANIYNNVEVIGTIHDGKYGMSKACKILLETRIQVLEKINESIMNCSLNYKSEALEQAYSNIADGIEELKEALRR